MAVAAGGVPAPIVKPVRLPPWAVRVAGVVVKLAVPSVVQLPSSGDVHICTMIALMGLVVVVLKLNATVVLAPATEEPRVADLEVRIVLACAGKATNIVDTKDANPTHIPIRLASPK